MAAMRSSRANRVQDLVGYQLNSVGQSHLAAILFPKKLAAPQRQIKDSLRDWIHPEKRMRNKRENAIAHERSHNVY
jgi:hypothetical protein